MNNHPLSGGFSWIGFGIFILCCAVAKGCVAPPW